MMIILLMFAAVQSPEVRIDGPWWRLAAPPKLEKHATGKEQAVDFTVFRAADGTWQLISCIRGTAHPGKGRLLYRWQGKSLTDADWEPKGIFLTSDPALGHSEGRLQAPHAVVEDGTWWLFYSSAGAHAMTSKDGKSFTPAKGADGTFRFFEMPRDLMLFDNRERDGKWYAFFTDIAPGEFPERKDNTVSFRTAPRLAGPWSRKTHVGVVSPPPKGYVFANAESPFVFFRDGAYYRFEQLNLLRSNNPASWSGPPVAQLNPRPLQYLAPEVIEHEGQLYLAAYKDHGKSGIFLSRLAWR